MDTYNTVNNSLWSHKTHNIYSHQLPHSKSYIHIYTHVQHAFDAFEMKGPRKILRVSWTAKKINEWVLNNTGVRKELLKTVKAKKLAYNGHIKRKQASCLEKEIMRETTPGACRRGRPRTAWMDNIKTWTGLTMEESIRMAEDRDR